MLQREYDEVIKGLADNTRDGQLKSRLCALIFLISKLPRDAGVFSLLPLRLQGWIYL
jgi:hypothetical protein